MRQWVNLAEQKYPGRVFEQSSDFYVWVASELAKQVLHIEVMVQQDVSDFVDDRTIHMAEDDAQSAFAYRVGYGAFIKDTAANNTEHLDKLVTMLGEQ